MTSNCSLHRLEPLDPRIDPAYQDGPPPLPHRANHAGEIQVAWPVALLPERLRRSRTISIEALEEELERQAQREDRFS